MPAFGGVAHPTGGREKEGCGEHLVPCLLEFLFLGNYPMRIRSWLQTGWIENSEGFGNLPFLTNFQQTNKQKNARLRRIP